MESGPCIASAAASRCSFWCSQLPELHVGTAYEKPLTLTSAWPSVDYIEVRAHARQ